MAVNQSAFPGQLPHPENVPLLNAIGDMLKIEGLKPFTTL